MTQFSYSRVSQFQQCPLKFKFHYIDKVEVDRYPNADDPLLLGKTMDTGLEHGFEEAFHYYRSEYPYVDQASEVELTKLKHWIEKLTPQFEGGQFQLELSNDWFLGYADYYRDGYLCDFKYASRNSVERYRNSAQLHLYYNIMTNMGYKIDKMEYVIIPKVMIRQKKTESPKMFHDRLIEELEATEIIRVPVEYDPKYLTEFGNSINDITMANTHNEFPPVINKYCSYCEYNDMCEEYKQTLKY